MHVCASVCVRPPPAPCALDLRAAFSTFLTHEKNKSGGNGGRGPECALPGYYYPACGVGAPCPATPARVTAEPSAWRDWRDWRDASRRASVRVQGSHICKFVLVYTLMISSTNVLYTVARAQRGACRRRGVAPRAHRQRSFQLLLLLLLWCGPRVRRTSTRHRAAAAPTRRCRCPRAPRTSTHTYTFPGRRRFSGKVSGPRADPPRLPSPFSRRGRQ